jgi:hypothetical protein
LRGFLLFELAFCGHTESLVGDFLGLLCSYTCRAHPPHPAKLPIRSTSQVAKCSRACLASLTYPISPDQFRFSQPADGFESAERFLDALANPQRGCVARMSGGAHIQRGWTRWRLLARCGVTLAHRDPAPTSGGEPSGSVASRAAPPMDRCRLFRAGL